MAPVAQGARARVVLGRRDCAGPALARRVAARRLVLARRPVGDGGDAAVGRRGPGGVPHPRVRVDREGAPAAGAVPRRPARRAAGVPDGDGGHRAAVRCAGSGRGRALVDPGQPGEPLVRCRVGGARGAPLPTHWRRARGARGGRGRHPRPHSDESPACCQGPAHLAGAGRRHGDVLAIVRHPVRVGRPGLQPARLPDRARRAVGERVHAEVLAACDPAVAKRLAQLVAEAGAARLWVPAAQSRAAAFAPGADLRGPRDLPVLIVATADPASLDAAVAELAGRRHARGGSPPRSARGRARARGRATGDGAVAVFNRGTLGAAVTPDGTLWMSLFRACSGWPSGVWIDGDRRTAPDGSSFAWQHWSHTFALRAGLVGRHSTGGPPGSTRPPRTTTTT